MKVIFEATDGDARVSIGVPSKRGDQSNLVIVSNGDDVMLDIREIEILRNKLTEHIEGRQNNSKPSRTCVICGARVTNVNPKATTCGPICTQARNAGLTRQQMIEKKEKEPFPEQDGTGCKLCGCRYCICETW